MEVDSGLALNVERARKLAPLLGEGRGQNTLKTFFSAVVMLPFDAADARAAAAIRAALKTQGQPVGAYDVLIAGTALARGLVVVTSNAGEFKRVSGLQLEDWR